MFAKYRSRLAMLLIGGVTCGCNGGDSNSGPTLETVPVSGRVLPAKGKPWQAGIVSFVSAEDPERSASGVITDGEFKLQTNFHGKKYDGAAEGEYTVMVIPGQSEGLPQVPIELTGTTQIEGTEPLTLRLPARIR